MSHFVPWRAKRGTGGRCHAYSQNLTMQAFAHPFCAIDIPFIQTREVGRAGDYACPDCLATGWPVRTFPKGRPE